MSAYQALEQHFKTIGMLRQTGAMLQWDSACLLPSASADVRAEQLAALAEISHQKLTSQKVGDWLGEAGNDTGLDDWQRANLAEMQRQYQHETAIPERLVSEITKACIESEHVWRGARPANDFQTFLPQQQRVLDLVREAAHAKSAALALDPYDALIDQYDPGSTQAIIDPVFNELAAFLPGFIAQVIEKQAGENAPLEFTASIDHATQKKLGELFMERLGFDFSRGRLDESAHPFCGGVPGDVRLTTRYKTTDFLPGFFGVLHETGHALYEIGLPVAWRGQPVGEAAGMAAHESQSLLVEMQLAQSIAFLEFATPILRDVIGSDDPALEPHNLQRLVTRVEPSLIRVDADEVTYPAHIILRYRLEKQLIKGSLDARHLPEAWREGMLELLGIAPDNDRDGCMQDIHWPEGMFGYFPSYSLGAMTAAQWFAAIRKAIPNITEQITRGDFSSLLDWLRANIHSQGSRYSLPELLKRATGETLNFDIYKAHLTRRYLDH